jgi:hypothetical protein
MNRNIRLITTIAAVLTAAAAPTLTAAATPDAASRSAGVDRAGLPTKVVVRDSRTSPDDADIASVELRSSWYWMSEHEVIVNVPDGMQAGQHLTVWFDIDLDSMPEGR